MKPGDIVLIRLGLTAGAPAKLRPALILALLPGPYQNLLVCGISTQLQLLELDWDERITIADSDFAQSGLHQESAARLSYLMAVTSHEIVGVVGRIDPARLTRLRARLALRLRN